MPFIYAPSAVPLAGLPTAWNWNWATLGGADALDFLHRVTSAHVREWEVGQGGRGCFLTPLGKLRGYFHLWRYGPDEFGFEFDGGEAGRWQTALFAAIDQFTFAERMSLTPVTGLECRWILADTDTELRLDPSLPALSAGQTAAGESELRFCHQGSVDFGRPWLSVWGRPALLNLWADRLRLPPVTPETLEAWRVQALRPRLDRELTENTVPLEAGLVEAIGMNKGCYPGQEVIEKIISLGSPAKRLALIEGTGPLPAPFTPLLNEAEPPAEVGSLTTVTPNPQGWSALGYLRKNYAKEGLEVKTAGQTGTIKKIAPYA